MVAVGRSWEQSRSSVGQSTTLIMWGSAVQLRSGLRQADYGGRKPDGDDTKGGNLIVESREFIDKTGERIRGGWP